MHSFASVLGSFLHMSTDKRCPVPRFAVTVLFTDSKRWSVSGKDIVMSITFSAGTCISTVVLCQAVLSCDPRKISAF